MRRDFFLCVLLFAATLAVYGQVAWHDFVNIDDDVYVYENPRVRAGLTWDGVTWAFTTMDESNWHPLTWLSHMLDCQLFGLNAGFHHLVNVLLHILNSVLLYLLLKSMTDAPWRSAMVAALFALHPLHVESVAWVSERKDVLSTLFFILTLWAYGQYAAHPSLPRYGLVFGCLALGLMAKTMLVTVPFVLLLLDYWPLERLKEGDQGSSVSWLIVEKVPLFALVALSSVVTFIAQQRGGAMPSIHAVPLGSRIENALVSYIAYIGKMLWPARLAIPYPYRDTEPAIQWVGAAVVLAGITVFLIWIGRRWRYLATGWLWYMGTLVPVIGLVQVGEQAMADRYTYVPLIGLFVIAVWGAVDLVGGWRRGWISLTASASVVIIGCMAGTWFQVGHWQNSLTLFERAARVTEGSALIHNNLGLALKDRGRREEAIRHFEEALRIDPGYARAHSNLGVALMEQGKREEAIRHCEQAIRIDPTLPKSHLNLGFVMEQQGKWSEAISHFREVLRLDPENADALYNLGNTLMAQGKQEEAIAYYQEALRIDPQYAQVHGNLGVALMEQGKPHEALIHFREEVRIDPRSDRGHHNLGIALIQQGKLDEAVACFREVVRLNPEHPEAQLSLALALAGQGRLEEAIPHYEGAIRLGPDDPRPYNNLAWIRATHPDPGFRNGAEAVRLAERACELSGQRDPNLLDTLAAAYAEAGRFPEAVATAQKAAEMALSAGWKELASGIEKQLQHFKEGRPYREAQ